MPAKKAEEAKEETKTVAAAPASDVAAGADDQKAQETEADGKSDAKEKAAEFKSSANEEPVVKSGFHKVKVTEFRGSYKDAKFDDNGVCERISQATLEALKTDYPGAEIELLD